MVAELDALRATGADIVFVVDDNLVGNKKGIKPVLRAVVDWQIENGYPLTLFTEASLDLAEDEELMRLMVDANILSVFVGIESPNEASLRETKKLQNIRSGVSMISRIHAIQRAGIEVWSGMILGFDNDDRLHIRGASDLRARSTYRQRDGWHAAGDSEHATLRPPGSGGSARSFG